MFISWLCFIRMRRATISFKWDVPLSHSNETCHYLIQMRRATISFKWDVPLSHSNETCHYSCSSQYEREHETFIITQAAVLTEMLFENITVAFKTYVRNSHLYLIVSTPFCYCNEFRIKWLFCCLITLYLFYCTTIKVFIASIIALLKITVNSVAVMKCVRLDPCRWAMDA